MSENYPELEIDLSFSDRFADLIDDGFDLAIRTGTLADRAGTVARVVGRQPMVVCAAPSYISQFGTPGHPQDLMAHNAVVYCRTGRVSPFLFPRACETPLEVSPRHRIRLDDMDVMADAAAGGHGVAWLPFWLVRKRLISGELVRLLPDYPPFLYDVHAFWLQTPQLPLKVRLAIERIASDLPRLMVMDTPVIGRGSNV